jgi:hypothetical protein
MEQDDEPVGLEGVRVAFDARRAVSDAGIALVAVLSGRLGIERLVSRCAELPFDRPGAANAGRKAMASMLLGADPIDDCEVLRAGGTRRLLGGGPGRLGLADLLAAARRGVAGCADASRKWGRGLGGVVRPRRRIRREAK